MHFFSRAGRRARALFVPPVASARWRTGLLLVACCHTRSINKQHPIALPGLTCADAHAKPEGDH